MAERARRALQSHVASPLGIDLLHAADGIIRIAATTMSHVVTRVTTERGLDAGDFAMVAYGGAGPLHACLVARELRMPKVIIPPSPGHFSAYGMLVADLRRDFVRTWFRPLEQVDLQEMRELLAAMEQPGIVALAREVASDSRIVRRYAADMRYVGQEHAVTVDLPDNLMDGASQHDIKQRFDALHAQHYGFSAQHSPAEIVSLHASVIGYLPKPSARRIESDGGPPAPSTRPVYFSESGGFVDTAVYQRDRLPSGFRQDGPLLVEEYASTTVVLPGDALEVGPFGDLIITIGRN